MTVIAVCTTILMVFQTVVITVTKTFHVGVATATIPCHKAEKNADKPLQIVCATVTIPCHNVEKNSVNELHNVLNASTIGDIDVIKLFQTVVAIETIPCHNPEKKPVMPDHTPSITPTTVVNALAIALQTL